MCPQCASPCIACTFAPLPPYSLVSSFVSHLRGSGFGVEREEREVLAAQLWACTFAVRCLDRYTIWTAMFVATHNGPQFVCGQAPPGDGPMGQRGTYAIQVLLAKHKSDGKFYAVKVLQKATILKKKEERHVMAERNVLVKNCSHPFLVGLHYSFQTTEKLYFVLDYVNGGELFFHLQRERCFPEPRARFYTAEIASAIGYLHSLNIIYRDLKPENILLDFEGHIKLTDFGLCKEGMQPEQTTNTFCGTPEYLAPEILRKEPYDRTVDWWCLGSVLYEMLYGLPPFYCRDIPIMYDNILHKPVQLRPPASPAACDAMKCMLWKDKSSRLGAQRDFEEIKSHKFFESIAWEELDAKCILVPFRPTVDGPDDLQNFDIEFLEQPVTASVCCDSESRLSVSVMEADDAFLGFSYAPPIPDDFR
uniref:serine/threonine-protein kinase Sgk2-like isoform X5 n=1 Tax=Myxine glutinosa TaxID=7769 RepID=UPI00358E28E0